MQYNTIFSFIFLKEVTFHCTKWAVNECFMHTSLNSNTFKAVRNVACDEIYSKIYNFTTNGRVCENSLKIIVMR